MCSSRASATASEIDCRSKRSTFVILSATRSQIAHFIVMQQRFVVVSSVVWDWCSRKSFIFSEDPYTLDGSSIANTRVSTVEGMRSLLRFKSNGYCDSHSYCNYSSHSLNRHRSVPSVVCCGPANVAQGSWGLVEKCSRSTKVERKQEKRGHSEMLDLVFVILGFLLVIAMMAFVINSPDAWIKRVFYGKQGSESHQQAGD